MNWLARLWAWLTGGWARSGRVVFLLGSGASKAAGLPTMPEITRDVTDGLRFQFHTDGRHYLVNPPRQALVNAEHEVQRSVAIIRCASRLVRLQTGASPNYEEVYFLLRQVLDHLLGEFENPALIPLVREMERQFSASKWVSSKYGDSVTLLEAVDGACDYIRDAVWRLLQRDASCEHLRAWAGAVQALGRECAAIVSLNHDDLAREALVNAGVSFVDGFDTREGGVSDWAPPELDRTGCVKLIQLHGSLKWFWTADRANSAARSYLARVQQSDLDHLTSASGMNLILVDNRPCLSVGTHNKVTDYFKQPFSELYSQVTRLLRESGRVERLVLAGYGGADKGVNLQISDWMQTGTARRIVLVHPDPKKWLAFARPHIAGQWPQWEQSGRARAVPKKVEDVTTKEWVDACRR